jgi:hypothetical protein
MATRTAEAVARAKISTMTEQHNQLHTGVTGSCLIGFLSNALIKASFLTCLQSSRSIR